MSKGIDKDDLEMIIGSLKDYAADNFTEEKLLKLDHDDVFPVDQVREMCGEEIGIHLLFIPEEFEGMGGGAFDVYRVCETLARIDIGVATGVLATFLGSDPIIFGATHDQKKKWMTRVALEGLLMAYGATEPDAGSDLGALRTTATPVKKNGSIVGYKLNGNKQWISNGGYADLYTVLANAPGGPTWFVVEKGTAGFSHGTPEDKHGIRASNTAALMLEDVYVDAENLIGDKEGQGLLQAQLVFGYTRLMVAAFGLGGGWAAIDIAIPYSKERIQAGGPLSEKQGYTHKLIIPHIARLEAGRAFIEETAERIDGEGGNLNTEGAIAKYMATEAGNMAADASIQALGGYGYTREYMVEKFKRDVRITTIYEGTSEIMEMTIGRDRWQMHLKTRGQHYHDEAKKMEELHSKYPGCGANIAALALHALAELLEKARLQRLTRNQHILFRLGELIAYTECAASLAKRAARNAEGTLNAKADTRFKPETLSAISRIFAREAANKVAQEGTRWVYGANGITENEPNDFEKVINLSAINKVQSGLISDMNFVADIIYERIEAK